VPDLEFPLDATNFGTLWQEVAAKVQDLGLDGIAVDRVVMQQVPWLLDSQPVPCVLVCPDTVSPDPDGGTNERDNVTYRFIISFFFANDRNITTSGAGIMAYWHETTRKALQNKSNSTWPIDVPSGFFILSRVGDTTTPLLIEAKRQAGLNAMFLVVDLLCREPRT
jgi:hypothetical protein